MITTRDELNDYIKIDALANKRSSIKAKLFGDDIWKFILTMRRLDYYSFKKSHNILYNLLYLIYKYKYHNLSLKLSFSIPYSNIGKGFSIVHYGPIVISNKAKIGENCRIHECTCIGGTDGSDKAAQIGNNVFISTGVKIIGDIKIADDVAIGSNAVVVNSICEPGTTWGGIPAIKISNNNSHKNLSALLDLDK